MSDIKLVNKKGKIVGIDPETGNEVPIELGDAISDSLNTESLQNNLSNGGVWQSINYLLGEGYVVNSLGNVYGPGGSAVQDALDDLENNNSCGKGQGQVWAGNAVYNPVSTSASAVKITGMGRDTTIDGGTTAHAFEWTGDSVWRLRMEDIRLKTDNGAGNNYDALHIETGGNADMGEVFSGV